MAKRTISAFVAIALLALLVWADVFTKLPIVNSLLGIMLVVALYEVYKPFGFMKKIPLLVVGAVFGLLVFNFDATGSFMMMQFIVMFAVVSMFVVAVICHKTVNLSDICTLFFMTAYVSFGMLHIRLLYKGDFGLVMILTALIAAFLTDTGAYFSGYFFGKHKLIPEVSPKKTVEGAIGGVVVAMLSMVAYSWILTFFGIKTNILNIVIIGGVASVMSQFGDLSASLVKRSLGIKDYGDIMPGHGGVLDRIDSLIFTAPVVFYLDRLLTIIIK
ncbi:MAG: phosphatidate cytidylyltransferase [Clostridia bacterium]|nr:phosphatidate cytidylyltransferase [Clostridia bacterium]